MKKHCFNEFYSNYKNWGSYSYHTIFCSPPKKTQQKPFSFMPLNVLFTSTPTPSFLLICDSKGIRVPFIPCLTLCHRSPCLEANLLLEHHPGHLSVQPPSSILAATAMPGSNWRRPEMVPRRVQLFPSSERRWDVKTLSSDWAQAALRVQQGCQGCPTRVEHIRRAPCNMYGLLILEEFHISLIPRHQDVSPVQFLLVTTTTVASIQQTASVLLAAPTTSAAWPSCGEQEGVTSLFPDNWQCRDLQMCSGLQQQSKGVGDCPGGKAKVQHRVLLSSTVENLLVSYITE